MLRLSLTLAFLAAVAPCQVEEVGEPDVREVEEGRGTKERPMKGVKGEVPEENLTPEQRLARNVTSGASAYCRFSMSVTPARLMPGQTGTLKVLAALQGNTVMPAPAPMELVAPAQQGALAIGPMVAQPAAPGRLAAAYLGRPVYDNYAIFELPVTMAADAPLGSKHIASVDMKFDLYDGASAQPIGRFLDRVALEIEVGAVADPAVKGFERPAAAAAPAPVAPTSAAAAAPQADGSQPSGQPLTGNVVLPEPAAPAEAPAATPGPAGEVPPIDAGGGSLTPLYIGGALLLVVVAMLVLRRR